MLAARRSSQRAVTIETEQRSALLAASRGHNTCSPEAVSRHEIEARAVIEPICNLYSAEPAFFELQAARSSAFDRLDNGPGARRI